MAITAVPYHIPCNATLAGLAALLLSAPSSSSSCSASIPIMSRKFMGRTGLAWRWLAWLPASPPPAPAGWSPAAASF